MDADLRYITLVCLAGILGLAVIFGLAASGDAPQRKQWHALAARMGLQAETLWRPRLSGYYQGHYVAIERYLTPTRDYWDVAEGILWTRIVMTVKNPQATTFILGRSAVLSQIGGWFKKQFASAAPLTLGDDRSPQSFFVTESPPGVVQSLLLQGGKPAQALLAIDRTYFIQLDGPQLNYTELGTALMDRAEIEDSARRLKSALSLMHEIAELIEMQISMPRGTPPGRH